MCMKKSKLSSKIVAMILSALTSLFSVEAMFENPENYEPEQYDEFDNKTNPEYDNLKQRLAVGLDDFKKKVNNADFKDLDEEIRHVEDLLEIAKNGNDPSILDILNNDMDQKIKLINDRSQKLSHHLDIEKRYIETSDPIFEENEEENEEENGGLHSSMRDDKSSDPILNEIPNFEEEIKSSNLNIGEIIPGTSTDTKFLDSSDITALNLIYDKNNNQVLEENEQLANNKLNNVGTSNNQYSNEVISSNVHAEDYSSYENYVTSEFISNYIPGEPIIRTQFDRNIKAKIDEIIDSKHRFRLYKIRVGDTVVCVVIKDLTDRCAFRYLDKGQLLQEIGSLISQWDGILPCVINSIKSIVNLDGNLVSNIMQNSNNYVFNREVDNLL